MKHFALIGAAGYVAPKHMKAIFETGNRLVAATDKHDSVGILDSFFPQANFFDEYERFDRFLEKQRRDLGGTPVDYISICSPNYLHDAHCRLALRVGADAICEKPLVINPWNIDPLRDLEQEFGKRVFTVLQLRLHPQVIALRNQIAKSRNDKKHEVVLTYVTRRGRWYQHSWKGDEERSGGVATNIGIHFFDFLLWVFGSVEKCSVHLREPQRMSGSLELEMAHVRWFLSVDESDLPKSTSENGEFAFRSIRVDGNEIDLSAGFLDLHTEIYRDILNGNGFGLDDAYPGIDLVYRLRTETLCKESSGKHPFLENGEVSGFPELGKQKACGTEEK